jgi:hypothetical protein
MTVLSRGARPRRGGRRPGWPLLTALLVLAIAASSALVFTNRVELLKLAVILALWAAVVAAFVSVIYRRQSDADAARARDLKLVYDLQLDREISARREYELTVESHLRRELASELRAQAADEVAALRAELAALRNNLEILFETELTDRPAIETERTTVRAYSDWERDTEVTDPGRNSARFRQDVDLDTGENRIIDVAEEPLGRRYPTEEPEPEPEPRGRRHRMDNGAAVDACPRVSENGSWTSPRPEPVVAAGPGPDVEPGSDVESPGDSEWSPVPAEGQWLPAGTPGSNWASGTNGVSADHVPAAPASAPTAVAPDTPRGRHASPAEGAVPGEEPVGEEPAGEEPAAEEPVGEEPAAEEPAAEEPAAEEPAAEEPAAEEPAAEEPAPRHRVAAESPTGSSQHGEGQGQSVAELLARLQTTPTGGGRRRRRDD